MTRTGRATTARRTLCVAVICAGAFAMQIASAAAQMSDTTPPDTMIVAGPSEGEVINTDAPAFGWASSEQNSTFACTVDGAPIASCDDAFTMGATPGPHTFTVAATDPAGNTDPTPATRSFTVRLEGVELPELGACPLDGTVFLGTPVADSLTGSPGTDLMFGYAGDDVLSGASGADCIAGQAGNDRLFGGPGGDYVFGGGGDDRIDGGSGSDKLYGERGNDRITGDAGNDLLDGGPGRDHLSDSSGRDSFVGGSGNDLIDARDRSSAGRRIPDRVSCGSGRFDVAIVDRVDRVATDCERVLRR